MQTKRFGTKPVFKKRKRSNDEIRPLPAHYRYWLTPLDAQFACPSPPTPVQIRTKPMPIDPYDADKDPVRYENNPDGEPDAYNLSTTEEERATTCPHFDYYCPPCNDCSCIYYLTWKRQKKTYWNDKTTPKIK